MTATLNGQQYVYSQTPEGIVTIKYPDGHIQTLPDISISQLFVINTGGTLMLFALSPGDSNGGWPHYILLGSNTWIHLHAFYWVPTGDGRNYFVPATQIMSVSPLGSSGWTLKVADYLGSFWCTDTVKNVWLECN